MEQWLTRLPLQTIAACCSRVGGLVAMLLLLGCDVIRTPAPLQTGARMHSASIPVQNADPSDAPADLTPTSLPADLYLTRARDRYQAHDLEGAIANYSAALASQPDSAEAYLGRGLAYYAAG